MRKHLKNKRYRNTQALDLKVLTPEYSHMSIVTTDPHEVFTRTQWLASKQAKIVLKINGKVSRLTRDFNEGKLDGPEIIGRLSAWKEYYRQVREFFNEPRTAEDRVADMLRMEFQFLSGRRAGNVPRHPLRKYQGFTIRQIQQRANEKINAALERVHDMHERMHVAIGQKQALELQIKSVENAARRAINTAGQALAFARSEQAWIVFSPTYTTDFWLTDDPFALQTGLRDLATATDSQPFTIRRYEPTAATPYVDGVYMSPAFATITADLALMTESEDVMDILQRRIAEPALAAQA